MNGTENLGLRQNVWTSPPVRDFCRRGRPDISRDTDEPIRRQMCQRCPSCIQIRSISEYSSERTPLIASSVTLMNNNSGRYHYILVYLFSFILVLGTGVGIYLLILESKGAIIEEFDYVSRENWGINSTFLKDIPPLKKPASKTLLLQLNPICTAETQNCLVYEEFLDDNKEKIKIFSGYVLFNFYQDKNGKIFEGRGWNFQSDCGRVDGCGDILTIGLIEGSKGGPSSVQIKKLKAFLDYCIMDNALKQCYEIIIGDGSSRDFEDLAITLEDLNREDQTCEYYT